MNRAIWIVARQDLRMARTNRLAIIMLGIFIGMVLVSGFIGWAAHHNVSSIYNEALREGVTAAPNPFLNQPPLELIKNTVIYVVLIGALMAILLGEQSSFSDRKARVVDLLFARPLTTRQYVFGKLLGIQILTGVVLLVAGLISWLTIWLISGGVLTATDTASLLGFFLLAWIFLLPFSALGFYFGASSRRETAALLVPILLWGLFVFVVPQLGTAEHPASLLNPVPSQSVSQGPFFTFNREVLQTVSVTDQFKNASAAILHYGDTGRTAFYDWLSLAVIAIATVVLAVAVINRDAMRRQLNE